MKKIEIVRKPDSENPFLVINKPHGLPSAPVFEGDRDNALFQALELYPEIGLVHGKKEIEKGLVHRLDTVTSGLILIATTQSAYDYFQECQSKGQFVKYYRAECDICTDNALKLEGFPKEVPEFCNDNAVTKSFFRPYGEGRTEVRPVTENSGKAALKKLKNPVEYETRIEITSRKENKCTVMCRIVRGYRHQVRCHLAWAGFPVLNDPLYNAGTKGTTDEIAFEAVAFEFPHPETGETVRISL